MSYNMQTFQHANLRISSDKNVVLDMRFEKEMKCLTVLKEKKLEWYVIKD